MSEALEAARARRCAGEDAWLVGGAVRDRLLGRDTDDIDLAIAGDPKPHARRIARAVGGAAFELSGAFGAWRVVAPEHAWHVDLVTLRDDDIHADLAQRDFTINAMAEPLGGGELLDPHGGRADLEPTGSCGWSPRRRSRTTRCAACARSGSRSSSTSSSTRPPAARRRPTRAGIERVAAERVFAELKRVVSADAVLRGLALMDEHGLTDVVLPELSALQGHRAEPLPPPRRPRPHARGARPGRALQRDPAPGSTTCALLAEPLSDELTRGAGDALGRAPARRRQAADARLPPRRARDVPRPRRRGRPAGQGRARPPALLAAKLRDYVAALIAAPPRRGLPRPPAPARPPHDLALPARDAALQRRHHAVHRRRPPRHARRATPSAAIAGPPRRRARAARRRARAGARRRWCAATS